MIIYRRYAGTHAPLRKIYGKWYKWKNLTKEAALTLFRQKCELVKEGRSDWEYKLHKLTAKGPVQLMSPPSSTG